MGDIRGLIFDKDGTLFDFRATWSDWSRRVIAELAGESREQAAVLARAIGFDPVSGAFDQDSLIIAHTPTEIAEAMLPHLPGVEPAALIHRMNAMAAETPMTEAVPLVPLFRGFTDAGLRIGLATNDAEFAARRHLNVTGIDTFFHFISGFDSGYGAKPDPGPLLAFARGEGLDPASIAMVGDSRHDLVSGRAAGMRTVAVLTGIATRDDLAPFADIVLPDIGHLPGWIGTQASA